MTSEQKILILVIIVLSLTVNHMISSMYRSGLWDDCLGGWSKELNDSVSVIDKCKKELGEKL